MNQNFYNSNSSGFDQIQPPQYYVMHQPPEESVKEFEKQLKTVMISALEGVIQPPQEPSVEILQARENLMKSIQTFLKKFNRISFRETPKVLSLAWEKFFEIQHAFREKQHQPEDIQELLCKLLKDLQIISEELAEYISPKDEHLDTISKMESNEEYESSVEDLNLTPSEFEDLSDIENEEIRLVEKLLYANSSPRSSEELNSKIFDVVIKCFSPSPIPVEGSDSLMEEIDIFLASDDSIPPGIENDDYDLEGDILVELLNNGRQSLPFI
ncbi:hypothetical protein Tco_1531614 [Tanacetum coccineum]